MLKIEGRESPEMYLKAIYLLNRNKGYCRHVDMANHLGVSKASVTVAVSKLQSQGLLKVDEDGMIQLTGSGQKRAHMVYDKFCFMENLLKEFGLDSQMAESEACKLEHLLSDEDFMRICSSAKNRWIPSQADFLQERDAS